MTSSLRATGVGSPIDLARVDTQERHGGGENHVSPQSSAALDYRPPAT